MPFVLGPLHLALYLIVFGPVVVAIVLAARSRRTESSPRKPARKAEHPPSDGSTVDD